MRGIGIPARSAIRTARGSATTRCGAASTTSGHCVIAPRSIKLGWLNGRTPARHAWGRPSTPRLAPGPRLRTRTAPSEGAAGCSTQPEGTDVYGSPAAGDRLLSDPVGVRLAPSRRWSWPRRGAAGDAGDAGSCPSATHSGVVQRQDRRLLTARSGFDPLLRSQCRHSSSGRAPVP